VFGYLLWYFDNVEYQFSVLDVYLAMINTPRFLLWMDDLPILINQSAEEEVVLLAINLSETH